MTQCDVRKCSADEVVPLFKRMTKEKPVDVHWEFSSVYAKYKSEAYELRIYSRPGYTSFEFYIGVDNIRFDGIITDEECLAVLADHVEHGIGSKVSDFISI